MSSSRPTRFPINFRVRYNQDEIPIESGQAIRMRAVRRLAMNHFMVEADAATIEVYKYRNGDLLGPLDLHLWAEDDITYEIRERQVAVAAPAAKKTEKGNDLPSKPRENMRKKIELSTATAKLMENSDGARTTLSLVSLNRKGKLLVGSTATCQAVPNTTDMLFGSKPVKGRKLHDKRVTWVEINSYSPSQVGAFVITKMKETVVAFLKRVEEVVVTFPATRDAVKIKEPNPDTLAYGDNDGCVIAVSDFGGRTHETSGGVFEGFPEILQGVPLNPYMRRYNPPFEEFEVDRCILNKGASVVFPAVPGPSIFLVTLGRGSMCTASSVKLVSEGNVLFAPAGTEIGVTTEDMEFQVYRTGVNTKSFPNPEI